MPTGYTAPVQDGEVTELKDFAAVCARAFGSFIHQRDDSMGAQLVYPSDPTGSFYEESLNKAIAEYERWKGLTEEQKFVEWSEYVQKNTVAGYKSLAKSSETRARYNAMLAKVEEVKVPEELQKFKEFMVSQLTESIRFDCGEDDSFTKDWYKSSDFQTWCADNDERMPKNITRYREELQNEWDRYHERVRYIDLMRDTFGFEVKERSES